MVALTASALQITTAAAWQSPSPNVIVKSRAAPAIAKVIAMTTMMTQMTVIDKIAEGVLGRDGKIAIEALGFVEVVDNTIDPPRAKGLIEAIENLVELLPLSLSEQLDRSIDAIPHISLDPECTSELQRRLPKTHPLNFSMKDSAKL